jgi:hypothetical protein
MIIDKEFEIAYNLFSSKEKYSIKKNDNKALKAAQEEFLCFLCKYYNLKNE